MAIAESLKNYLNKFYNLNLDGESVSEVFQEFLEDKYGISVEAGDNFSEMLDTVIKENDSLPQDEPAYSGEVPLSSIKKVYMKMVNNTEGDISGLTVSTVVDQNDYPEICLTATSLPTDGEEKEIWLLGKYTTTLVFWYFSDSIVTPYNIIGEYLDGDTWKDAPFYYVGHYPVTGTNDQYYQVYIMNQVGTATSPLANNRHLRFRCEPIEDLAPLE